MGPTCTSNGKPLRCEQGSTEEDEDARGGKEPAAGASISRTISTLDSDSDEQDMLNDKNDDGRFSSACVCVCVWSADGCLPTRDSHLSSGNGRAAICAQP